MSEPARTCRIAGTCPRCGSDAATDGRTLPDGSPHRWCIDPRRVCSWGLGEHDRGSRAEDEAAAIIEDRAP